MKSAVVIRREKEPDWPAIHALIVSAFGRADEAEIVEILRRQAHPYISLMAEQDGSVVGYIMFTPVILSGHSQLKIMGLAPMAVSPVSQRQGIGAMLVHTGLDQCKRLGFGAVVVLGHPRYYPRFGFSPSSAFGIHCEYEVPEEAFMVVELHPGYLRSASGTVAYLPAFSRF